MNLGEMKQKVLRLIEEIAPEKTDLTDDQDIKNKINDVINQVQYELARIKKITAIETIEVKEGEDYELSDLDNFYQLDRIKGVKYEHFGNYVEFEEEGIAKIYYYKYPKRIDKDSKDTVKLEISDDALEIMPYGVAADLLKSDVSNQYGNIYANRYNELKNGLDPRYATSTAIIEGGIDI